MTPQRQCFSKAATGVAKGEQKQASRVQRHRFRRTKVIPTIYREIVDEGFWDSPTIPANDKLPELKAAVPATTDVQNALSLDNTQAKIEPSSVHVECAQKTPEPLTCCSGRA